MDILIDPNLLKFALTTALTSFIYALSVYFSKTKEEKWDFVKAGKTAILGGIVGFIGAYYGLSESVITGSPLYSFVGIIIERILKIIQRKIIPQIKELLLD